MHVFLIAVIFTVYFGSMTVFGCCIASHGRQGGDEDREDSRRQEMTLAA